MSDAVAGCVLCCTFTCILACALGPIALWVGYGIKFLVTDYSVCGDHSNLWIFCVVVFCSALVIGPYVSSTQQRELKQAKARGDKKAMLQVYQYFLRVTTALAVGLAVYGGIILFGGYTCSDMKSKGLYIWATITFYFYAIAGGCALCITPCFLLLEDQLLENMPVDTPDVPPVEHADEQVVPHEETNLMSHV
jgi:Ni/Fe-hydrogenase subunit HybB-like protein